MAVSRRLRFEVFRRDDFTCRYCGGRAPDVPLAVDHVVPRALGGPDDPENLVTSCRPCNEGKASITLDSPLVADVAERYQLWAVAVRGHVEHWNETAAVIDVEIDLIDEYWMEWTPLAPRPNNWRGSIHRWIDMGFTYEGLRPLVRAAMEAKVPLDRRWVYFCGVVWRKVDALTAAAEMDLAN